MQERSSKVIAIVALCVGVVGLSLGFAAFSASLTVSSEGSVTVSEETFVLDVENLSCVDQGGAAVEGATATSGSRTVSVSGINAAFTAAGQSVTCTFDVTSRNYNANLISVTGGVVSCDLTSQAGVAACDAIDVIINHGETSIGTIDSKNALNYNTPVALTKGAKQTVTFKIDYPAGSQLPDGVLDVTIPNVVFSYQTV